MSPTIDCNHTTDPLKLIREGTNREQRLAPALNPLDPAYPLADERSAEHGMVFAQAYSAYLKYYAANNAPEGDWKPFFNRDVSVRLAVAAADDVTRYRQNVKEYAAFLTNRQNGGDTAGLRDHLDYLFSCCASLALGLERLTENLPEEIGLKLSLRNQVRSRLAPSLIRLIAWRKGGETFADGERPVNDPFAEKAAVEKLAGTVVPLRILGEDAVKFSNLAAAGLSGDWTDGADWATFYGAVAADASLYGGGTTLFDRANHLATHTFFTTALDQFLKVYARIVGDAKQALEKTLTEWERHEPHYALFLAFLRLFGHARAEVNTLTGRHLDFYYREVLRLREKDAGPGHVHLLVEPAKHADGCEIAGGTLFNAGKDDLGSDAFFASTREFTANQAKVAAVKSLYRHGGDDINQGRLYASPVADSADGAGAELASEDQSWHPFSNRGFQDGSPAEIRMPMAEIGFAVASHYLLMAEGERWIWAAIEVGGYSGAAFDDFSGKITCRLTTKKGWIEKGPFWFFPVSATTFWLMIHLEGADPPLTPYLPKTHGYSFDTELPVLLVQLKQQATDRYLYPAFRDLVVNSITLHVFVYGLKTLAVSNDFGPVDTSKPFQPFGATPARNSALVIGSKELFQKKFSDATVQVQWQNPPAPHKKTVTIETEYLESGLWRQFKEAAGTDIMQSSFALSGEPQASVKPPYLDIPDLSEPEYYTTSSRCGFVRLRTDSDFGWNEYQADLLSYLRKDTDAEGHEMQHPGNPPLGPSMIGLAIDYSASQTIALDAGSADGFAERRALFFHLAPFGQAEQHPRLASTGTVRLLPQFEFLRDNVKQESEAELYIGVTGLKPPQSLALLFQVADGTADPLAKKPDPHIHWSYLAGNGWFPFAANGVEDRTGGLLNSGIVTFAVPRDASDHNSLLPAGMHWIRAAVASESGAVCRLRMAAAQALEATFTDRGNDTAFPAKVLQPGTISKLDQPDAAVRKIIQPFPTFGGRGREDSADFHARVSERLRHKDRAIALWDLERLVLQAFPPIYQARCLNHTEYEPSGNIYRELAPGHVTLVTIPNQRYHKLRDPLRPYTSLGLLEEIADFLERRISCFATLHVKNPQFEEVKVEFNVRLHDGLDESVHVDRLQEAVTRFLSPWAFPGGGAPSFGGTIRKAVLINFVEELPYVDYVTDFKLLHLFRDFDGTDTSVESDEATGSKAVSILVSARKHGITPINPAEADAPGETCACAS
jgi:hypothetical protein